MPARYKLTFTTPPQSLPQIKTAIFAAGAGVHGAYTEVCFTTPGVGQFRPGPNSNPAIGSRNELQEIGEVRCETVCEGEGVVRAAVEALKGAHPYEEVVYEVYKIEDF